MDSTNWQQRAACVGQDPELFFPTPWTPQEVVDLALAVCGSCLVAADCEQWANETHIRHGIWGGKREFEREVKTKKQGSGRRPDTAKVAAVRRMILSGIKGNQEIAAAVDIHHDTVGRIRRQMREEVGLLPVRQAQQQQAVPA